MYQFVIPVHHVTWSTRSVLEGVYEKYKPKHIYIITSENEIKILKDKLNYWKIKNLTLLDEDNFFLNKYGLTKNDIVVVIFHDHGNGIFPHPYPKPNAISFDFPSIYYTIFVESQEE